MRTIGHWATWILGAIAYLCWLVTASPLAHLSIPLGFWWLFLSVIVGVIVILGGCFIVIAVSYFIWRPRV